MKKFINKVEERDFSIESVNKACSMYLFENKEKNYKKNIFYLLRYSVSGNPVGAPVGDICDIIGKASVLKRMDNTIEYLKDLTDEPETA